MIRFKEVTLNDRDEIQAFTMLGDNQNCDLSFANLISWRFLYDTQFAIVHDYLVFRFYSGHHLAYLGPISRPNRLDSDYVDKDFKNTIRALRDDAIAMGHPFLLTGVSKNMVEKVERAFPEEFRALPERNIFDYIYNREKLEKLSGKHLQSKRNHCNKFRSLYPQYEYRPLTKEMIPLCVKLEEQWRSDTKENSDGREQSSLNEELRSMTRSFLFWDNLDCIGGTIFVDDKLVSFTFGSPVNHDTFDVCVEKADVRYEGSFSVINQEFVRHLPEQFVYINREDDMGEEGLRRSKLSYKPDLLLEKYSITEKHPLENFTDTERLRRETEQLWRKTFHDSEPFIRLYFDKVFRSEYNIVSQIDGKVAGALQTLPFILHAKGQKVPTAYISGVCVDEARRRQNIGTNIMRQAHNTLFYKGVVFACLIPAERWLFGWYSQCGYSQSIRCVEGPVNVVEMSFVDFDVWQHSRPCFLLHSSESYSNAISDLRLSRQTSGRPALGMLRVINVQKALSFFARLNPDYKGNIRIYGDKDIASNNTYFSVEGGNVTQTDRPLEHVQVLTISELSLLIMHDLKPEMTLMMN